MLRPGKASFVSAAVLIAGIACHGAATSQTADVVPSTEQPAGTIPCERDSDCHAGAGGPCSSGDLLAPADMSRECVVNPCTLKGGPQPAVVCSPKHLCTIR